MLDREGPVPKTALLLSLLCLWVPVLASALFPEATDETAGVLVWLLALVPGFLLSYYRGWRGASLALAGGMAAISVAQVFVSVTGTPLPSPEILAAIVGALTVAALGSGWLATVFRRSLEAAEEMALTDPGTGLPNRRLATMEVEKAFAAAERGEEVSVVLFDLDRFKRLNDEHGHAAGDRVLEAFGELLGSTTRTMNLSARFGGEEFLSVVRGTGAAGAHVFADRVRRALKQLDLPGAPVTVSAGVAEYEPGMASPEVLIAAADRALYQAKNGGRDRVVVLSPQGRTDRSGRRGEDAGDAASAGTGTRTREDDDGRGEGELVLVVDDDPDALRSVARVLRRWGYTVFESDSPARAVDVVRGLDDRVDLVMTDIVMPEMSGFRLVEMLGELQDEVRVVYMSGYSQEEVDWAGVPGSTIDYLSKPISVETLTTRVRQVLDEPVRRRLSEDGGEGAEPERTGGGARAAAPDAGAPRATAGSPGGSPAPGADVRERGPSGAAGADPVLDRDTRTVLLHGDRGRREILRQALENAAAGPVRVDADPAELARRLPSPGCDLLVVDLDLPRDTLEPVIGALREDGGGVTGRFPAREDDEETNGRAEPGPSVLLLAGDRNATFRRLALERRGTDVLVKPFGRFELEARVRSLLRMRALERRIAVTRRRMQARIEARTMELEEAREEVLRRLAWAAEYRDDLTGVHAERVGAIAGAMAREMGWSADNADILEKAAPLHDLGKIAVPDSILRKPGELTPTEREIIRDHTTIGAELLAGSRNPVLREAERIARSHHERWNGSGYPDALAGDEIPRAARIVAVADSYDSMMHDRPYRQALGREESLRRLRQGRGKLYDPRVVDAFFDALDRGAIDEALDLEVVAQPGLERPAPGPSPPPHPDPRLAASDDDRR